MQRFPDDFNQQTCKAERQKIQDVSLCVSRQDIYSITNSNRSRGYETTFFKIPSDLGTTNGIILCGELLERFDSLDVTFNFTDEDREQDTTTEIFTNIDDLKKFISEYEKYGLIIGLLKIHY